MQPNSPFTPLNDPPKKLPIPRIVWAIVTLVVVGGGYSFSQSNRTGESMNTSKANVQARNGGPGYLETSDPVFISIKDRAVTDLKQSVERSDPKSPENKPFLTTMEAWPQQKKDRFHALVGESIEKYISQTRLSDDGTVDVGTFLLVFKDFGEMEEKRIAEEHDIRVQYLGGDKYVAELWQDGLAVYSDKNIPDNERKAVAKERYAIVRKSIEDGKQERYTKMLALLYTLKNDGSITFHDPFQPVINFMKLPAASGGKGNR